MTVSTVSTVADRIADELSHRILVGILPPGERLRQDVFAYEFGASHVPVREAFRRLEMKRLVESLPRRGVRVTLLNARGEREIANMRTALEVLAVRSAAGRPSPKQLEAIQIAVDEGDKARDIHLWESANRAFHHALAVPSAMPRLIDVIDELNFAYSRYVIAAEQHREWRARSNLHHRHICEAYAEGNIDLAAALLTAHIKTVDRISKR